MFSDEATIEAPQLKLPPDLIAEVSRRSPRRQQDFHVDHFKPTLFERLARILGLGD